MKVHLLFAIVILTAGTAGAQSTISPVDRHAYAANAGWINFRPSAADGVYFTGTFLGGKAWAANFGWISFGTGTPANGHTWQNNSASDSGVNLTPEGHLTGYAWSANAGWITFEQTHGRPRLSYLTGQLSGHAWSANLGWISLETNSSDLVTFLMFPDTDGDGLGDAWEQLHFQNLTTAGPGTDSDGDGSPDTMEYAAATDPLNSDSLLRIVSHNYANSGADVTLAFTSQPDRLYSIEHATDFSPWVYHNPSDFVIAPAPGAATTQVPFTVPAGPRRFFRVSAFLPLIP